ncbi:MAG: hypothetical protein AAGP08_17675 [Pseudomonadota bacterium]
MAKLTKDQIDAMHWNTFRPQVKPELDWTTVKGEMGETLGGLKVQFGGIFEKAEGFFQAIERRLPQTNTRRADIDPAEIIL